MNIVISNTSGVPIYEQIKEQIRAAIINGEAAEGELLPSIRALAHDLKISVITTMRAYNDLVEDGYITNIQGKGCYVLPKNREFIREQKLREIEGHLSAAISAAKSAEIGDDELLQILTVLQKESK